MINAGVTNSINKNDIGVINTENCDVWSADTKNVVAISKNNADITNNFPKLCVFLTLVV